MEGERRSEGMRIPGRLTIAAVILIVVLGFSLLLSVSSVGVGYVAVVVDPIAGTVYSVGDGTAARYFIKAPWAQVRRVYVTTDSLQMWTEAGEIGDYPAIPCLTSDGLGVNVDIAFRWTIAPSRVVELYKTFPKLDWKDTAIYSIVRQVVRDTLVKFTAMETIEQREAVSTDITSMLISELEREPSLANATVFGALDLREIALPATFVGAIEEKLAAEQAKFAAEFNKTRIVILANATKEAAILEAEGIAQSRIIIANATYESIKAIAGEAGMNSTELTNLYLTLEAMKEIAKTGNVMFLIATQNMTYILPL